METHPTMPIRKTNRLRTGRVSIPGARYFVTVCTQSRKPGLTEAAVATSILSAWRTLQADSDIEMHCATIMPEHIHMLFTLGQRLKLSQTQQKFKSKTQSILSDRAIAWQDNYFDHRLRDHVPMERFARYIFLNPYRKHLLPINRTWADWVLSRRYKPEFTVHLLPGGTPPKQWLTDAESAEAIIEADCIDADDFET